MNPTAKLIEGLDEHLTATCAALYGSEAAGEVAAVRRVLRLALGLIARSDALYHDLYHTTQVTLASQAILRGWHRADAIESDVWMHVTAASILHDIGMVRGVCAGDTNEESVVDHAGSRVSPPRGASDAYLTPYHVDRGMIFVRERAGELPEFDVERLARCIEMTRFPVPDAPRYQNTGDEAGLVRAADLIGQLGDPHYLSKATALYHEFVETGMDKVLGFRDAADLVEAYPAFFKTNFEPYLTDGLRHLERTAEGRAWVASLRANIAAARSTRRQHGPQSGPAAKRRVARAHAD